MDYNSQWLWLFETWLKLLISFHILSEKETHYFLMETFDNCHLSNPELRVHNLQMFGHTLVNLARQSGPHTVGKKGVREREMEEVRKEKVDVKSIGLPVVGCFYVNKGNDFGDIITILSIEK